MPKRKKKNTLTNDSPLKDRFLWGAMLLLLLITGLVFSSSLQNGFVDDWDDQLYVTQNPLVLTDNIPWDKIWKEPVAGNYHPITMISLAIDHQFSGREPFGYHLTNLLLHLANVLLVFFFFLKLTDGNKFIAFFSGLLFGIHPMHVESVAWISERKDVLYTFFFFIALICYLQYLDKKKLYFLGACFLLFILSLLSKPAAVIFPLILLLIDWQQKREINLKMLAEKIPFLALSVVLGYMTLNIQSEAGAVNMDTYTFFQRFLFASFGFVAYLGKLILPLKLSVLYPFPEANEGFPAIYYAAPVLAAGLVGIAVYSLKFTRNFAFAILFYLISIVLVLQIISVGSSVISDRYTYVPYAGIFFFMAWGVHHLWKKWEAGKMKTAGQALVGLLIAYSLVMGILSFQRVKVWENSEKIWTSAIRQFPNLATGYINRGNYYLENQQAEKALMDYNKALEVKPRSATAWNMRGKYYFRKQQYRQALEDFNQAVTIAPNKYQGYNNRGGAYYGLGSYNEALADYAKVLQIDPRHDKAYGNRAAIYTQQGKYQEALVEYAKAIQLNPINGGHYANRSLAYNAMGKRDLALQDALTARKLGNDMGDEYINGLR
jgi:tetratricopeptide (TPR) repeat protein